MPHAKKNIEDSKPSHGSPSADAVCFTAGAAAGTFGAGVIHAYLASNREPPAVLAGISLGAVNAAAMQRCYDELRRAQKKAENQKGNSKNSGTGNHPEAEVEKERWRWYRKYLDEISKNPLKVIWNGIPKYADFFSDLVPVVDPVPARFEDRELAAQFMAEEAEARKSLYLFVLMGQWLASLPVPFSHIVEAIVRRVRAYEKYPQLWIFRRVYLWVVSGALLVRILLHITCKPQFVSNFKFRSRKETSGNIFYRGLLLVWGKIVRLLPFYPKGDLTWYTAWAHLKKALSEAWGAEKGKFAENLKEKGWRQFITVSFTFVRQTMRRISGAVPKSYRWELPIRPMFGWKYYGLSLLITAMLLIALFTSAWNFALPRVVDTLRQEHTIQKQAFLIERLDQAKDLLQRHRILIITPILEWVGRKDYVTGKKWLNAFVTRLNELQRDYPTGITVVFFVFVVCVVLWRYRDRMATLQRLLQKVELHRALVNDYHLCMTLQRLFGRASREEDAADESCPCKSAVMAPTLVGGNGDGRIPLVVVAATLQLQNNNNHSKDQPRQCSAKPFQLWAKPETPLTHALRAALSYPGLFKPVSVEKEHLKYWLDPNRAESVDRIDLVDGSVIRQNPLPALFRFLEKDSLGQKIENKDSIVKRLFGDDENPGIHVVYGVPIRSDEKNYKDTMDIISVTSDSLALARRRDTQLEVELTKTVGQLQRQIDRVHQSAGFGERYPVFADEIAPESEIRFQNPLAPTRDEILRQVAHGCRKTLETIFKKELSGQKTLEMECSTFLKSRKTVQMRFKEEALPGLLGLPEICERCPGKLRCPAPVVPSPYETAPSKQRFQTRKWNTLKDRFPNLVRKEGEPSIIFVASGGVFRGSFHGGMLGALVAMGIQPQLIVGASVGTLIGGALAAMNSQKSYPDRLELLDELVGTFLHVDTKVAFTKSLKTAARDLGIRGRKTHLSLNKVRRLIRRGSRSDPGYAALGSPPALVDAISRLFLMPHRETSDITAEFVAGHVARAIRAFFLQIQRETLPQLEVEHAVIGASLLEMVARRLMGRGDDPLGAQPFGQGVTFMGTTTNLASKRPFLLGFADTNPYQFIKGALASSAFPAVFEPRRESEIFPNHGRADVLFADGGMFDNIPFSPALYVLREMQLDVSRENQRIHAWYDSLLDRHEKPNLILAGSLDINPTSENRKFEGIIEICARAGTMQNNVKINGFERSSKNVDQQIAQLLKGYKENVLDFPSFARETLNALDLSRDHAKEVKAFLTATNKLHKADLKQRNIKQQGKVKNPAKEFLDTVENLKRTIEQRKKLCQSKLDKRSGLSADRTDDALAGRFAPRKTDASPDKVRDLQETMDDLKHAGSLLDCIRGVAKEMETTLDKAEDVSRALLGDLETASLELLESLQTFRPMKDKAAAKFYDALGSLLKGLRKTLEIPEDLLTKYNGAREVLIPLVKDPGRDQILAEEFIKKSATFPSALSVDRRVLNGLVNPAVLPVFPVDAEHLNGTFHFCASVGMKRARVLRSIANGCFQTFRTFADRQGGLKNGDRDVTSRSLKALMDAGAVPAVGWKRSIVELKGCCPYFECSGESREHSMGLGGFVCPFFKSRAVESSDVFKSCKMDKTHKSIFKTEIAAGQ